MIQHKLFCYFSYIYFSMIIYCDKQSSIKVYETVLKMTQEELDVFLAKTLSTFQFLVDKWILAENINFMHATKQIYINELSRLLAAR